MAFGTTTTTGARRASPGRVELVVLLGALSAFGPLSIDMYLPALPALREEFGTGPSQAQLTLSACLLGLALGQVVAGPLSDALGRIRPMVVGVAGYAVASLLCALAPSVDALAGLRLLQGLCGAAGIVIARAIVRDLHSGVAAARFFSVLMLVSGAAPILAPIFGGQLLRFTSWRGVFVALALIGAILAVAAATRLAETHPPERRQEASVGATLATFGRLLRDRSFVGFAAACGLAIAGMFAYIAGSPFVLQEIYGASPQRFSLFFGMNALGLMAMGQINGRLVGRMHPATLLTAGLIGSSTGGVLFLAMVAWGGGGLLSVLPPLFLTVASLGFVMPNATALALSSHPRTAGSASALLGVMQYVVGAAAAPLVGIAGEGTALPMGLVVAAAGLAALLVFLLVARPVLDAPAAAAAD